MSTPSIDIMMALTSVGIDCNVDEETLEHSLRTAIGERRGYLGDLTLTDDCWELELLFPVRETFRGRTRVQAHAWCLVLLMGERGEIGISGFRA